MNKLKVAFLWHQHQPYYKIDSEFILPWVLLHGTKDYFDIPELLFEFPSVKQTFNFAPSLSLQLDEYISGKTKDRIQRLTSINANTLSISEKNEILSLFFHSNYHNMISPYPRFKELYEQAIDKSQAIDRFTPQDWLDLQVWYNLSWFGYFSQRNELPLSLINKGRNFDELEKLNLQEEQNKILSKINIQYRKLHELGQIELSCSPMYHPILPLLINSESALETKPEQDLPNPLFNFPEDAELQLRSGLGYFNKTFGSYPNGVWPSEGSVSDETLKLMIRNKISWVATDEQILHNSLVNNESKGTEKFFPRVFKYNEGEITVFFRDHFLSDRIGFEYSRWNETDAASDFMHHLRSIKHEIIKNHGEAALEKACVSVILDGENCWEYYRDNGIPFLRELYKAIANSDEVETVTFSEALIGNTYLSPLTHIKAGSWINGNFDIWIGHNEDIKAWNILSRARHELRNNATILSPDEYKRTLENLMIAEGSDWFWWYGPEHHTDNKPDFDRIFRHYVQKAYQAMKLPVPEDVMIPINSQAEHSNDQLAKINIGMNLTSDEIFPIKNAAYIKLKSDMSAMHRIGDFLDSVNYGNDDKYLYIKINFQREVSSNYEVRVFIDNLGFDIYINSKTLSTDFERTGIIRTKKDFILLLPIDKFESNKVHVRIESLLDGNLFKYPNDRFYEMNIIS